MNVMQKDPFQTDATHILESVRVNQVILVSNALIAPKITGLEAMIVLAPVCYVIKPDYCRQNYNDFIFLKLFPLH